MPSHLIRTSLRELYAEVHDWPEYRDYPPDEIAIRLKYRVVQYIPFRMAMAGMGACSRTSLWFDILDWSRRPEAEVHCVIQMQRKAIRPVGRIMTRVCGEETGTFGQYLSIAVLKCSP